MGLRPPHFLSLVAECVAVVTNEESQWTPLAEFPEHEISSQGTIRRLVRGGRYPAGHVLTPHVCPNGYLRVAINSNKMRFVHKLLAQTFLPNPSNKPFVNHKDGNKLNNGLGNPEWVTAQENVTHAWQHGLCSAARISAGRKSFFASPEGRSVAAAHRAKVSNRVRVGDMVFASQLEAATFFGLTAASVSWSLKHNRPIAGLPAHRI